MQVTAIREEPADRPNDNVIESLAARAARLAYFSPDDLKKSLQVIAEGTVQGFSSIRKKFNNHNVVAPLLKLIHGKIEIICCEDTGCQVYVFTIFDEVWIAFRGTQVTSLEAFLTDISTDINCELTGTTFLPENCLIHSGFMTSYVSVRERLLKLLLSDKLRLIGHSLGGALATLLAGDIFQRRPVLRTFGCPCVGNDSLTNFIDSQIADSKRFTIKLDPVPIILEAKKEFSHVREHIEINEYHMKHKVEYYIKVLCQWANVDFEGTIEDEYIQKRENFSKVLTLSIALVLFAAIVYSKVRR